MKAWQLGGMHGAAAGRTDIEGKLIMQLGNIEGRKFCVVFVKTLEGITGKVQLQCLRGRASVDRGRVSVISDDGCTFTVPGTAVQNILPSDGTPLLKDAEYFCLVKVDPSIHLSSREFVEDDDEHDCDCHDHDCDCHDHHHDHDCHDHHHDHDCHDHDCHDHHHDCDCGHHHCH